MIPFQKSIWLVLLAALALGVAGYLLAKFSLTSSAFGAGMFLAGALVLSRIGNLPNPTAVECLSATAALSPIMLLERFDQIHFSADQMVIASALLFLLLRYSLGSLIERSTWLQRSWRSVPLAIFCGLILFLAFHVYTDFYERVFYSLSAVAGFLFSLMVTAGKSSYTALLERRFLRLLGGAARAQGYAGGVLLAPLIMLAMLACYDPMVQAKTEKHFGVTVEAQLPAIPAQQVSLETPTHAVLRKYCFECHASNGQEAELRIDQLNSDFASGGDEEPWSQVLDRIQSGEMPPPEAEQPSPFERGQLTSWIKAGLQQAASAKRQRGEQMVMRRLSRYEYENTMCDLLGVDGAYGLKLPPEPASPEGFQNNGVLLQISSLQMEYYLETARAALKEAIVSGDQPAPYHKTATRSGAVERPKYAAPPQRFRAIVRNHPPPGEFRIRLTVSANFPGGAAPWITVDFGTGAVKFKDIDSRPLGEHRVTARFDEPQVFEYRGRIEKFPQSTPDLGMMVIVSAYDANGVQLRVGSAAQVTVHAVEIDCPFYEKWPPESHEQILFSSADAANEQKYARQVIGRFMRRAFRRPVQPEELQRKVTLFQRLRDKRSFVEAMRETLATVLISPHFLYLTEPRAKTTTEALSAHELAARLSYFLWSTTPDDRLSQLADAGRIDDPDVLESEVSRLLADERSWQFVEHFTTQWLDLDEVDRVAVDPEVFRFFDGRLKEDMQKETLHFFAEILHQDLSALNLIDSNFVMLNNRLARHYQTAGPANRAFARYPLEPGSLRGGLLGQASILLAGSNGRSPHPIKRAVWIRTRLLDDPPADPPANVPSLEVDKQVSHLTFKQQLELHRQQESCKQCHRGIDPWGVPLESLNAIGLREEFVGRGHARQPVETFAVLPDGASITGANELKHYLLTERRDEFARTIVKRILAYALGRSLDLADDPVVDDLTMAFIATDFRLKPLITAIVQSSTFQTK